MTTTIYQLFAAFVVYRLVEYLLRLKRYHFRVIPGYRTLFGPYSMPGALLPTSWWNKGHMWSWTKRGIAHFNYTSDVTTTIPVFGQPYYFAVSHNVGKQILGVEGKVESGVERPAGLNTSRIWGHSVASANGEAWKRHRRIVAPVFNSSMYKSVIKESAHMYEDMLTAEGWKDQAEFVLPDLTPIVLRFTLVIISRCGFGLPIEWKVGASKSSDANMFEKVLLIATETLHIRLMVPNWIWSLPFKSIRRVNDAWSSAIALLQALILRRKSRLEDSDSMTDKDIMTQLASATDESRKYTMGASEVTANMLSLLFAGNETTASGLMSIIVALACYPDEQEKVYQEIQVHIKDSITLANLQNLKYSLACVHEALRLIPPVGHIFRELKEPVHIHSTRPIQKDVYLNKNTALMVDLFSIAHNPHDFPNPSVFDPSRWLTTNLTATSSDHTSGQGHDYPMFGFGPRSCIGRKFAQTEILTFLVHLLTDWKVDAVLESGMSRKGVFDKAMKEAIFSRTAFALPAVPLQFSRR